MRAPFHALRALTFVGLLGTTQAATPTAPAGPWTLKFCVFYMPSTKLPCAYLSDQLTLRVENATRPPTMEFERAISPEAARQIYDQTLKTIKAIHNLPRPVNVTSQDGNSVIVSIDSSKGGVPAHFAGADGRVDTPEVMKLRGLLHDITGIAF